ncbi:MAG: ribosomal protection-like ABC-F family protein [Acutalibacteraceae bacterium]
MALIDIQHLSYTYDGQYDPVFEDVCLQLDTGWRLGFVGRNGRGKTTFLKLLAGELNAGGSIRTPVSFAYFPYPVKRPERRAAAILTEICPHAEEWRLLRELSRLDVEEEALSRPFATLSHGEQTKLLLAALFCRDDPFLLIDEPTNHLDERARAGIAAYLRSKNGFILVSHDRAFLDGCVDHILAINRTRIDLQQGNFSSWYENKQREDRQEIERNERLQADIRRLSAAARRTAGWSEQAEKSKTGSRNSGLRPDRGYIGHKAAKMMKRSKAIEQRRQEAAEEKAGLLHNIEIAEALKLPVLRSPAETLCALEEVTLFYGGRQIGGEIRFDVRRGERVALTGRNGCGKSSVLKLLLGEEIHHTGRIYRTPRLEISYVPQDASRLCGPLDAFIAENRLDGPLFRAILRKLDFERVQFGKDMADYSAGQKKKVLLAKSLCEPAHLYIWDEPLNYIDIFSRMQIEQLLLEYRPTLLFVEHDSRFRDTVATKTVDLV